MQTHNTHSSSPVSLTVVFISRVWTVSSPWLPTTVTTCSLSLTVCMQAGRLQPARPGLCSALPALPTQQTQSGAFQSILSWQTLRCITTHTLHVHTHRDTTAECFTMMTCHLHCWFEKIRQTVAVWFKQSLWRTEREWSETVVVSF